MAPEDVKENQQSPADDMFGNFLQPQKAPAEFNMVEDAQQRAAAQPAAAAAPDKDEIGELPTKVDDISARDLLNFSQTLLTAHAPRPVAAPGSFRDKLGSALGAGATGLGDAAAGMGQKTPFGAAAKVLQERHKRIREEKKEDQEMAEKKRMDDINYAHAQRQILLTEQMIAKEKIGNDEADLKLSRDMAAQYDQAHAEVLKKGASGDDIHAFMSDLQKKAAAGDEDAAKKLSSLHTVLEGFDADAQGNRTRRYTIYGSVPEKIKLSKSDAELLNEHGIAPPSGGKWTEGSEFPGSSYVNEMNNARRNATMDNAWKKEQAEAFKDNAEGLLANQKVTETRQATEARRRAINEMQLMGFGTTDPVETLDAIDAHIKANPKDKEAAARLTNDIYTGFGADFIEKERDRLQLAQLARMEKENNREDKKLTADQSKGRDYLTKNTETYSNAARETDSALRNLKNAKDGDEFANAMAPLFNALGISTTAGVRRISNVEVERGGDKVGSAWRQLKNLTDHIVAGKITDDQLNEMMKIQRDLKSAVYDQYARKTLAARHNYRMDDDFQVLGPEGKEISIAEMGRNVQRGDLVDYMKKNNGRLPQGFNVRVNPQTKQMIYQAPGDDKSWYDISTGEMYTPDK